MIRFGRKRSSAEDVSARGIEKKKTFKSVEQTYKIYTFLMIVGLMYPNPKTDKKRLMAILVVCALCLPEILLVALDIHIRIKDDDKENLVRQMIVIICITFALTKVVLTMIYTKEMREIYDCITTDYIKYNDLSEEYRETVEQCINQSKLMQFVWTLAVFTAGFSFIASAAVLNIYFLFFTGIPKRFMVHECHIWGMSDETVYSSPFYELYFAYNISTIFIVFVSFSAFDGMFSICIFHASLKIKIVSIKLRHVLDDKTDLLKIKSKIAEVVTDQHEMYGFINKLTTCYKVWLVLMFTTSTMQIGMSLIQITSKNQSSGAASVIFLLMVGACVANIFIPCYLCSHVTHTASQFADDIYSIPWEDVPDTGFRRSICIMIAYAQRPVDITALSLLTFNMEMFVSVLQTAYSMFTLLRS